MAANQQAAAVIGVLNKVMKYAVTFGVGASVLQTSLYNGELLLLLLPHTRCLHGVKCSQPPLLLCRSGWW